MDSRCHILTCAVQSIRESIPMPWPLGQARIRSFHSTDTPWNSTWNELERIFFDVERIGTNELALWNELERMSWRFGTNWNESRSGIANSARSFERNGASCLASRAA